MLRNATAVSDVEYWQDRLTELRTTVSRDEVV